MKNNNLISISGKIGSGKDTIGSIILYLIATKDRKPYDYPYTYQEYLDRKLGNEIAGWKIKKFADKLKDIVCILIGCTRKQLEDRTFKEQELGEEWWYYKYLLHESQNSIVTGATILDENGKPKRNPTINKKTGLQEWKFIDKDFIDKHMSLEEQEYHNVTLVKLTPRLLLQLLGTEAGRNIIHPNLWVNALFANYVELCDIHKKGNRTKCLCYRKSDDSTLCETEKPNWIITDMRFSNEMEAVEKRSGITIRVQRPEYCPNCPMEDLTSQDCGDCAVYQDEIYQGLHESETALDNAKFDYTIENNGTLEELIEKVREILIEEKII